MCSWHLIVTKKKSVCPWGFRPETWKGRAHPPANSCANSCEKNNLGISFIFFLYWLYTSLHAQNPWPFSRWPFRQKHRQGNLKYCQSEWNSPRLLTDRIHKCSAKRQQPRQLHKEYTKDDLIWQIQHLNTLTTLHITKQLQNPFVGKKKTSVSFVVPRLWRDRHSWSWSSRQWPSPRKATPPPMLERQSPSAHRLSPEDNFKADIYI